MNFFEIYYLVIELLLINYRTFRYKILADNSDFSLNIDQLNIYFID